MSIFGRFHGMGGGGGGGGGGIGPSGMLRTAVSRTVTAGVNLQDPISNSSATSSVTSPRSRAGSNNNSKSSLAVYSDGAAASTAASPFSYTKTTTTSTNWPSYYGGFDDTDWVSVNQSEIEKGYNSNLGHGHGGYNGVFDDFNFGPVPTLDEVQIAINSLKEAFEPEVNAHSEFVRDKFCYDSKKDEALGYSVSDELDIDWQEPLMALSNPRHSEPKGRERVYEAFSMLRNEPYVQRMVISLSSDEAIWDRVQNNKVVREIRELFNAAEDNKSDSSDETIDDPNPTMNFVQWIFDNTKTKVMEMFEMVSNLVNELLKLPNDEKATKGATSTFDEKVRTSFMLTIMVLLVVVVTRAHRA
ncbi:hypothetical protein ACFE04_004628 [Oxalis oulophora]